MIVLIDNYDSFTWNLYHFLGDLGCETVVHRNDKISVGQVISAKPSAIVISPGPCSPAEAGISVPTIKSFAGRIPLLGVCLGHQSCDNPDIRSRCHPVHIPAEGGKGIGIDQG